MTRLTVCKKGYHVMTPDNVWIRPSDGARYCRACQRRSRADWYATKTAVWDGIVLVSGEPAYCPRGHEILVSTLAVSSIDGLRRCSQCIIEQTLEETKGRIVTD